MVMLTMLRTNARFSWMPSRSEEPVRDLAILAAIVSCAVIAGAIVGRRLPRDQHGTAFILLLVLGGMGLLFLGNVTAGLL